MDESINVNAVVIMITILIVVFFIITNVDEWENYVKTKYENWRHKKELAQIYQNLKTTNVFNIYESRYNKFSQHKQTITILNKDNGFIKYQVIDYTSTGCTRTYEESSHIKEFYNKIYKHRYISLDETDVEFWKN